MEGELTEREVKQAASIVKMNGYHVLENVFPSDFVHSLRISLMQILDEHISKGKQANRGKNRYQLTLPLRTPFLSPVLLANDRVFPILQEILGYDCVLGLLSAHISFAGAQDQQPHIDYEPLFDNFLPIPPFCVYVHIPLVDLTPETGTIELWTGSPHLAITHCISSLTQFDQLPIESLTSKKIYCKAGCAIIKDMRCFHRGTANNSVDTRTPRPILSLVYCRKWYRIPYESLYREKGYPVHSVDSIELEKMPQYVQQLLRFFLKEKHEGAEDNKS